MMTKSAEAFRTISEAATELDVPQHVLRFWESKFGQIRPMKRGGGRRYYRPADIELLRGVRTLLYEQGYTIKGVQKLFREQGAKFVSAAGGGEADTANSAEALKPQSRGRLPAAAASEQSGGSPNAAVGSMIIDRLVALKSRIDAAIKADRARYEGARSRARRGETGASSAAAKKAGAG